MSATKRIVTIIFLILIVVVVFQLRRENVLKWHQENDYRWAQLPFRKGGKPGFKQLSASKTRITFSNQLTRDQITNNRHLLNGSGVAVGDVNGDGQVNVIDVVQLISFILGNTSPSENEVATADLNSDGLLNILDVVALISIILSN